MAYGDCAGDVHMALDAVGTDGLDAAINAAVALVAVRWPSIRRIADALAKRGQIDRGAVAPTVISNPMGKPNIPRAGAGMSDEPPDRLPEPTPEPTDVRRGRSIAVATTRTARRRAAERAAIAKSSTQRGEPDAPPGKSRR
jgi:hypothetical protein